MKTLLACIATIAALLAVVPTVSADILFQDNFEDGTVGSAPTLNDPQVGTWTTLNNVGAGEQALIEDANFGGNGVTPFQGAKYLENSRVNSTPQMIGDFARIPAAGEAIHISGAIRSHFGNPSFRLMSEVPGRYFALFHEIGASQVFRAGDGNTVNQTLMNANPVLNDVWHTFAIDYVNGSGQLYFTMDGTAPELVTVPIPSDPDQGSNLGLITGIQIIQAGANTVGYWDDILVTATAINLIPGDLNGDGFVGQDDLNIVLGDWGNMPPGDPRADPSGDGFVGQDDLNPVLADWGQGTPPVTLAGSSLSAAAVPEPSSILLLAIAVPGGLTLYRRRRRRTV